LETYSIEGVPEAILHGKRASVRAVAADGSEKRFEVVVRIDTPQEAEYYRNGGILPYVLRQIAATRQPVAAE
jgi:aconitate hydratase